MKSFAGLLKASHFGPTLIVTSISTLLALYLGMGTKTPLVALGVFTGQLLVGWSNDLIDYQDDLKHQRIHKPLVSGELDSNLLRHWLILMLPISFLANLAGPLGIKGGLTYMLGILFGVAYNFYFKFSPLSPLAYAIAFAALPASIALGAGITPPIWLTIGGAIFGVSAHFVNVLKDMSEDRVSGIGGLPQRLGMKGSIIAALICLIAGLIFLVATFETPMTRT
ncbi:MAG: UbiA family prenyltransferase [Candidatus Nanopelagicaceae bacterium]